MDSRYDHAQHESTLYSQWEAAGAFNPDTVQQTTASSADSTAKTPKKPFTIIMPPPNANDPLHVGHAVFLSLEDIMIRYHRMVGDDTLWLPGTDHAGIETQFLFEKKLAKKDQTRFDFDRTTLYNMIWEYVQENSGIAVDQMKKLGASADWTRFTFMLDEKVVTEAIQTFMELNQKELIYRDLRLVNYCTHCGTAFSELEVVYQDQVSPLYYMTYGPFTLATTRPETKFGDTAVAVHPDDKRYQQYIGQTLEVEGLNGPFNLKVIADEYVDPEFGTGVVKITPYHDFNDFDVWQRHLDELPTPKQVIGFNGKLNEHTGKYAGLSVKKARETVAADMQAKGMLVKIDSEYANRIGTCYRCGRVIEPLPLPQFFIKVKPLTEKALAALDNGELRVHGAGHDKILRHWLENLRDWNISRQIVWGIRLPVWYDVKENPEIIVTFLDKAGVKISGPLHQTLNDYTLEEISAGLQTLTAPREATYVISPTQPGESFIQETDTFDTWFSSGQWPFTTLMHSGAGDFERFYPTSVMETGYDILPFWVMRMLLLGLFRTGQVPFKDVYLHGLARDAKGQKMSKSKGNVINPLDVVAKYGADALRMALVIRSTAGLDKSVGEQDFRAMRNFTNKIWNAARFITMQLAAEETPAAPDQAAKDAQFYTRLQATTAEITQQLNDFKLGLAAETAYNEFWHWYCDECIEAGKRGELSKKALSDGLETFLKLLHPFVPFVTEAIWQELAPTRTSQEPWLITSSWPHATS